MNTIPQITKNHGSQLHYKKQFFFILCTYEKGFVYNIRKRMWNGNTVSNFSGRVWVYRENIPAIKFEATAFEGT